MISIYSEISPLNKDFLHSPGDEHLYVTPDNLNEWDIYNNKLINNSKYLLFDDLIQLDRAKQEHKLISDVIKYFIGNENCLEFNTLLLDSKAILLALFIFSIVFFLIIMDSIILFT